MKPGPPGPLRTVSRRALIPGGTLAATPSATRFRPPPCAPEVAHACRIGSIRENTDPRTAGNS
ncbi:hypothetical protein EVG18_05395 [Burkholderia pyrrocinia]|nr:hypothetical protein EVG18_05395 [Burkholderia pyrrocinia]